MMAQNFLNNIFGIVENRSTTGGHFYTNFDGLRALAALMVLNMHFDTAIPMATGAPGVFLFFGLSGFLLYTGFLSIKVLNSSSIIAYMVRRIFRILPLYIAFVLSFVYLYKDWNSDFSFNWAAGHLLFLQGKIHLWTIRAEMIFYLSLPFVIVALAFIQSVIVRFIVLLAISGYVMVLTEDYFAMFFIGMAAVHARPWVSPKLAKPVFYLALFMILILSTFTEITEPVRQLFGIELRQHMYRYGLVFFPLCFLAIIGISRFQSRLFSARWMRLLGVCGYGIYLWHILILYIVRDWQLNPWLDQITLYGLTIFLSIVTYILIEKPGINLGRRIANWVNAARPVNRLPPEWICLAILSIALGFRLAFSDPKINIQIDVWASIDAIAHVDLNNRENTRSYEPKSFLIKSGKWTRASFSFRDQNVAQIRFDLSEPAGHYKIRNFLVRFTRDDKKMLNLILFEAEPGTVTRLNNKTLEFTASENKQAPVLVYKRSDLQPWLSAKTFGVLMVPVFVIGFILISVLLNKMLLMRPSTGISIATFRRQS